MFVLSAAGRVTGNSMRPPARKEAKQVLSATGERIGHAYHAEREVNLTIDETISPLFATFLVEQLPALFDAFSRSNMRSGINRGLTAARANTNEEHSGKRKRPPKRRRSGSPSEMCSNFSTRTSANSLSRVKRRSGEQIFFARLRQRHADHHNTNDALWAATVDACPCGESARREATPARHGGAQMERVPRPVRGARARLGLTERSLALLNGLLTLPSRDGR